MNVIDYARNTELSGVRFYKEMADRATADGVKRIFSMLAHDEELLLEKLQRLQEKFPEMQRHNVASLTLQSNVFEKLRRNKEKLNIGNDVDAYRLATEAEREILRTYEQASASVEQIALKKTLMRVSAIERHELVAIESLLEFADTPSQSLSWGEHSNIDEFHNYGHNG